MQFFQHFVRVIWYNETKAFFIDKKTENIQQKIISGGKQNVNQNYLLFGLLSRSIWHLLLQQPTILGRRTAYKRERNHRGFNTQRNQNERLQ